jgi:hypothetical protein
MTGAVEEGLRTVGDDGVADFLADPSAFFAYSFRDMHRVDRRQMDQLQRSALARRFDEQLERIAMVEKLATRQGITSLADIEDVVPLLFEHTMYKSYPTSLLERQRFGTLTDWLAKLTSVDLSAVDATKCESIDAWLDTLAEQSEVDILHSSGTTGTMSFLPWSLRDHRIKSRFRRVQSLQTFDEPPTPDQLEAPFHFIVRANRLRSAARYDGNEMSRGEPDYDVECFPRPSADLLWLAARLRMAAARGDLSRVEVPASLLARRDELAQVKASENDLIDAWIKNICSLQGQRILWNVFPYDLYTLAAPRVHDGERWEFAPGSTVVVTGGSKGHDLPEDWKAISEQFLGARVVQAYGMIEYSGLNMMCRAGRYHLQPWLIPFVLDPNTSDPLPRNGVQLGRFAFFDLLTESHWGGLITGDEVEVDFDGPCSCGATTQHLSPEVVRLSEKRGGDDKISCTASPQAYDEAMQFLTEY